jgi:hypothetical protein
MPDDVRPEDEDLKETYHKVDQREWLREDEDPQTGETLIEEDAAPASEAPGEAAGDIPEIDTYGVLRLCLGMFAEQAWVQLGLQLAPGATDTRTDLKQAKVAIDTIAYIKDALAENLLPDEKREVEQLLATLRMNYVQRT